MTKQEPLVTSPWLPDEVQRAFWSSAPAHAQEHAAQRRAGPADAVCICWSSTCGLLLPPTSHQFCSAERGTRGKQVPRSSLVTRTQGEVIHSPVDFRCFSTQHRRRPCEAVSLKPLSRSLQHLSYAAIWQIDCHWCVPQSALPRWRNVPMEVQHFIWAGNIAHWMGQALELVTPAPQET